MKKILLFVLMVVISCSTVFAQKITYGNDRNASLEVVNDLDENIVLFLGAVNKRNFLGGVRAGNSRLISIRSKVQGDGGIVLVRAVKESVFKKRKYSTSDDDIVFAKMVVVDKNKSGLDASFRISSSLGGDHAIRIENNTQFVLELRLDNVDGPVFATFRPNERARTITMKQAQRGYTIFPTYVYYDQDKKQISSISTKNLLGGQLVSPRPKDSPQGVPMIKFEAPGSAQLPVHSVSYVTLINQSGRAVIMVNGNLEPPSQNGLITLNNGESGTYEFSLNPQNANSMTMRGLMLDAGVGQQGHLQVPPFEMKRGYDYTIEYYNDGGGLVAKVIELGQRGFDYDKNMQLLNENN